MALPPFKKKGSRAKGMQPKSDRMPAKVAGAKKTNRNGGVVQDAFAQTVTDTPPRMPRQVRGK